MKKKIIVISLLLLLIGSVLAFADHYFSCGRSYAKTTWRDENGIQRSIDSWCVPSDPCPTCLDKERNYFAQQRERQQAERERQQREAEAQRQREAEAQRQQDQQSGGAMIFWW